MTREKMQTLHDYIIDEKQWRFGNDGQYNFATKDGKEYLIKRLNFPRYPASDSFKGEFKQKKIDLCNEWLRHRQEIIDAIPGSGTGTIAKPIEVFREGSRYYEVSYMINGTSIPYYEVYKESYIDKVGIMRMVALSLSDIHNRGVIHGNLKPENILIYRLPESHNFVVRVIGFTNSFFEKELPNVIPAETTWQSPEVLRYNQAAWFEKNPNPCENEISCKLDVYSLGLIFHLYCSGTLPTYVEKSSEQEVGVESALQISQEIDPYFKELILHMLQEDTSKRMSMSDVQRFLMGKTGPAWPKSKSPDLKLGQQEKKIVSENALIKLVTGHGVKSAYIHPRNSRKVVLTFENGQNRIMDKDLAMKMGYVRKEETH